MAAPGPGFTGGDVVLKDGSTAHVRSTREGDEDALLEFMLGLSKRSRWLRFFSEWGQLDEFVATSVHEPRPDRLDLIVLAGRLEKIVAHGAYIASKPQSAEIAFAVDDAFQGRGLGTILLGELAEAADASGITTFEAVTLPENAQMLDVFRESGFPVDFRSLPGEVVVSFPTSLTPEALERFEARERRAAAAAVRTFLEPRSVAVIGASRRPDSVGGSVLSNLVTHGFSGTVFPVNPHADELMSLRSYPSVSELPEAADLAVVIVPAEAVVATAAECAESGVRSLVVISSGFGEVGEEGFRRQEALLDVCRSTGMRLVGPNCLGVINTNPAVRLNATFAPAMPLHGNVALLTQSGALGLSVIDYTREHGLGISTFVSNGNKADISGNDLLGYWEEDEDTRLVLLYLESFGNPRRFARIAQRVSRKKPIVAVKSGRSAAGARATSSHTGALVSASDVTVDALFRQSGVIRADTLPELFDVAALLSHQPVPQGDRVAIVTNAGGPGIMCADACDSEGLKVPALTEVLRSKLAAFLPAEASTGNPVDMIASASPEHFRRTIETIGSSGEADAIIAIYIPPFVTDPTEVAASMSQAADRLASTGHEVPVLAVLMPGEGISEASAPGLPRYAFAESAARALGHATRYARWCQRADSPVRRFDDVRDNEAAALLSRSLETGAGWLGPRQVDELLGCYGIPVVAQAVAASAAEASRTARDLGLPVALKAFGPQIVHKTDLGAVRLGLTTPEEVERTATEISGRLSASGLETQGFVVQTMTAPGVEMIVGVVLDEVFGPVVAVGAGGTTAELVKDVAVRLIPLTEADVSEMIRSLRTYALLSGFRGAAPANVSALEDLVHRLGAMVENHAEIAELDLNPVIVSAEGAVVVDARIRVEAPRPTLPLGARKR